MEPGKTQTHKLPRAAVVKVSKNEDAYYIAGILALWLRSGDWSHSGLFKRMFSNSKHIVVAG